MYDFFSNYSVLDISIVVFRVFYILYFVCIFFSDNASLLSIILTLILWSYVSINMI